MECKGGSVRDHIIRTRSFCLWNIQPRKNLNDWEIEEVGRLMDLLERYSLGARDSSDEMVWALDEEQGFSVKTMYDGLICAGLPSFPSKCVWNLLIQIKASFLLWELRWKSSDD